MPNKPKENLDRRDFMIASIATVGASAVLAANVGSASAQDAAAPSGAPSSTVYTGDVIQGKKVVSALDVNDLEPGKKHLLYFQGVQMPTGQYWYVSVTVARGAKPGKRVVLTSGVHGDEMSSVHTVQTVMNQLDPAEMSGTVMAVTDVSRPAIEGMQRRWPNFGRGNDLIDMNREWPGNENGATAPSRHAGLLFNRLLRPNADAAIDFHTGTTGFDVTAFNIGGTDVPEIKAMLELYPVGQIFDSHVYPGVLHNAFVDAGIPAFCPEIGAARVLDLEMISLFVEGTMNVLKHHGIVAGPMGRTGKDVTVFVGNSAFPILATHGGLVEHLVKLNDKVEAGQKVAVQRDSFGEVVAEYTSGVAGEVTGQRSDAMSEPGNPLVFILFNKAPPEGVEAYPE
ncbi:succinylglutamate desuccinylase/aspartoacylase family protein [Aminobacter anthyllidis]|uniref:Succinylglutamate desuccinylase/aspartoacylase family protein n=1 Tax=Aminobacter anthyllidis TaxID=1035067 RepID=A0A9X1AES6_9HYPH|nr:succinylglutamate desuccinylase/aspartoacylase family protein [Aminobacter anthyllidis]MBT1158438.1 succinylglutamate desuccinylase/aspartoacylase family protein [Aminobacter anthyllidis]